MPEPFADRLTLAVRRTGAPCCVGIDPRLDWIPAELRARFAARPTPHTVAAALQEMHRRIVDRIARWVPAIKPQLAFFEQLGAPGIAAYEDLVRHARDRGVLVIADAKRGDIGSTAEAYAAAFLGGVRLGDVDLSPPRADALTIQPWFGTDGVEPFLRACDREGAGLFVLVKTSNPSSAELQDLVCGDRTVSMHVAAAVDAWGRSRVGASGYSSVGAVVGATHRSHLLPLRRAMPRAILLLPGYGAQGGSASDVVDAFDDNGLGALVVAARSVHFAYRRPDGSEEPDWEAAIENAARRMCEDVAGALRDARRTPPRA